jgi:hypothetical protein
MTALVKIIDVAITGGDLAVLIIVARRPERRWRKGWAGKLLSLAAVLFVTFHLGAVLVPVGAVVALTRHRKDQQDRSPVPVADSWPGPDLREGSRLVVVPDRARRVKGAPLRSASLREALRAPLTRRPRPDVGAPSGSSTPHSTRRDTAAHHQPQGDHEMNDWTRDVPGGEEPDVSARDLRFEDVAGALRAYADGSHLTEAAVELLIEHGHWLRRSDFLDCIDINRQPSGRLLAVVDWYAVNAIGLPGSSGELQLLAIVGELAGVDSGRPLADLIRGLDDTNHLRVLHSLARAHGHPVPRF